jgi:hypothetical protein
VLDEAWAKELSPGDRDIVCRISSYFHSDLSFLEKVHRARLISLMDLEFDPVVANRGKYKATEVLRVANHIIGKVKPL